MFFVLYILPGGRQEMGPEKRRLLGARREAGARYWYWCWLWSCLRVDGKSRLLATRKEAYRLGTNKMVVPFLTDPV